MVFKLGPQVGWRVICAQVLAVRPLHGKRGQIKGVTGVSDTDSFIEEVTEEVRRDRLFGYMRRYGWIAVGAVVLIVGGAAWNEWRKAEAMERAQATGDAIFAAVDQEENAARVKALQALDVPSTDAQVVVDFLEASHQVIEGDSAAAADTLDALAASGTDMPEIYRQIAAFKSVTARGSDMPVAERRVILESMAAPGAPLALLAQEQLAILDLEDGKTDDALVKLQALIQDAEATESLRRRATQLIVALGGELPERPVQAVGQ